MEIIPGVSSSAYTSQASSSDTTASSSLGPTPAPSSDATESSSSDPTPASSSSASSSASDSLPAPRAIHKLPESSLDSGSALSPIMISPSISPNPSSPILSEASSPVPSPVHRRAQSPTDDKSEEPESPTTSRIFEDADTLFNCFAPSREDPRHVASMLIYNAHQALMAEYTRVTQRMKQQMKQYDLLKGVRDGLDALVDNWREESQSEGSGSE
jgi:hypothetical protein